jgi:uncharacterized protein (TIGR03435 family)
MRWVHVRKLAWLAALAVLTSVTGFGQTTASPAFPGSPAFEVSSIKPSDPKAPPSNARGGPGTSDPGQMSYTNLPLSSILMRACGMDSDQIIGPPSLRSQKYDIVAKIPPGTTRDQFNLMLINLLTERFHMAVHHETREFQGYELVIAKNGPKLKKSSVADSTLADEHPGPAAIKDLGDGNLRLDSPGMAMRPVFGARVLSNHLMARAQTLPDLARWLGPMMRTHIVDKTGLAGRYDFTLDYSLDPNGSPGAPFPSNVPGAPDIPDNSAPYVLDSVQEQLGLKLQPAKILLDTVIVDSVDNAPTEN